MANSPLLSSQPVLDSLFHRGAIICEGDPDRAVYQTVARHLPHQAGEDFLFIHSNGKDAAYLPAELLRKAGTPVCAITDFDILNSEKALEKLINGLTGHDLNEDTKNMRNELAVSIEFKTEVESIEELKENVRRWLEDHGDLRQARRALVQTARSGSNKWTEAKKCGLSALPSTTKSQTNDLLGLLAKHRLFVVPKGELESWMSLGTSKGAKWNRLALEELHKGNCPKDLRDFVAKALHALSQS